MYTSISICCILLRCWWVSQHICDKSKKETCLKILRSFSARQGRWICTTPNPSRHCWVCITGWDKRVLLPRFPRVPDDIYEVLILRLKKWWAYYGKRTLAKRNVVFFDLVETVFPIETPHYFPIAMLDGSDAFGVHLDGLIAGDKSREAVILRKIEFWWFRNPVGFIEAW